ncbi:MAG: hypothetical protein ACREAB_06640 [Blastocatellia bacterium]
MIRKTLFGVTLISLLSLGAFGLWLSQPAGSSAEAAASATAAQGCNAPIEISKFNILNREPGGGHNVAVDWTAPSLPACISVSQYRVKVTLQFPRVTREKEVTVPGNQTATQFKVNGFLTDTTPKTFTVRVTADLRTVASASGVKSGPASINP